MPPGTPHRTQATSLSHNSRSVLVGTLGGDILNSLPSRFDLPSLCSGCRPHPSCWAQPTFAGHAVASRLAAWPSSPVGGSAALWPPLPCGSLTYPPWPLRWALVSLLCPWCRAAPSLLRLCRALAGLIAVSPLPVSCPATASGVCGKVKQRFDRGFRKNFTCLIFEQITFHFSSHQGNWNPGLASLNWGTSDLLPL